jgi:DNA-binding MarR family transcriptional regulator
MPFERRNESPDDLFRISDPCVALRRATRAVTHLYDLVLAPTGVKATQFVLLEAIQQHGEIAQWRLAREYGMGDDTLSRRLSVLRKAGLVACRVGRERSGERLYRLTEEGRSRYEAALPAWTRARERLQLVMGNERWQLVLKVAEDVAAEARRAEAARFANRAGLKALSATASVSPAPQGQTRK